MKPFRAPKSDPVLATYGYAVTPDTAQSRTVTDSIMVFPDGSGQVTEHKAYTGMSRHMQEAHLVVSDSAERRAIVNRQMLGLNQTPREEDVVRNIATNLSRFGERETATDLLARAVAVQRGTIGSFLRGSEAVERNGAKIKDTVERTALDRWRISSGVQHVVERAHQIARALSQSPRHQPERGPRMGR